MGSASWAMEATVMQPNKITKESLKNDPRLQVGRQTYAPKTPTKAAPSSKVDSRELELVEDMQADVLEYIHGVGTEQIINLLDESVNTSETMAVIAYKAVRGVAEKHKATARVEMDMDMMLGVTTDAIDMIVEVAEAAGQVHKTMNIQQLKEDTLLRTTVMHGEQVPQTEENRQRAATDLRDYVADGADKAFDYVNKRAQAEGINPQNMVRAGNEMLYGTRTPVEDKLKEGVRKGLMDQQAAADPGAVMDDPQLYGPRPEAPPQDMPMPPPPQEQGIMGQGQAAPAQMPAELPTGQGLVPSEQQFPPMEDPNPALLPPGGGRR